MFEFALPWIFLLAPLPWLLRRRNPQSGNPLYFPPLAKLAAELSEDAATKEKGGDLGFFAKGKMAPEFEAAAFAAKAGEAVGPVKTTYGFHLIKVEEIREPILRPFEVVKQPLQKRLVRERQQMLVSALLKEIKGRIPTETNIGLFDIEE